MNIIPPTKIRQLGKNNFPSTLKLSKSPSDNIYNSVEDDERILYDISLRSYKKTIEQKEEPISFEKAGPREKLYFNPLNVKAGIVTCGGLCPGLNNVIRSIVMELWYRYNVKDIYGFKYGYEGLIPAFGHAPVSLNPEVVDNIHLSGGSILGSSRGNQNVTEIVKNLKNSGINILFCIGGDGTLKGAHAIDEEAHKQMYDLAVAGIPKTIDNDINYIERSFGFETAFSIARDIVRDAHNEAAGAYNGIALIKLMGRDSGFIAVHTALSDQSVNFVLIPEMAFRLDGENGLLNQLKLRLEKRHHAVIVVSEGAGQYFFDNSSIESDASGNVKKKDIGHYIKEKISSWFNEIKFPHSIRYIDPSYIIRSAPANANDSKLCTLLAQNAVHGAMAGKTDFVVGICNNHSVYLPIELTTGERKKVDLESELWWNVLEATGQYDFR